MPDVGHEAATASPAGAGAASTPAPKRGSGGAGTGPLPRARALWSRGSTNARSHAASAAKALDSARGRYDAMMAHPGAQRAAAVADSQAARARALLGRSESVRRAEALTGVDRLVLVTASVFLFTLLVPFNLLGLAHATTAALTLAYPTYKAVVAMERGAPNMDMHNLLSYFVLLGYFQTLESLVLRFLVSVVPRYYLVKLALMLYLFHPRTRGAAKLMDAICGPLRSRTPPPPPTDAVSPPPVPRPSHLRKRSVTPSSPTTPGSPMPFNNVSPVRGYTPGTATPVREGVSPAVWGTHVSPSSPKDVLA